MKKLIYLFLLFNTITSFAQTKECDCSAALSSDLTSITKTTEYRQLKEFLYEYFKSDATAQTSMKNDKHYNWTSNAEAVVDELPVKGTGNADFSTSEQNQIYNRLEQTYQKNHYLTDEEFNEVFTRTMSDNQLRGYLGCLELCKQSRGGGISSIVSGSTDDEFSIQISFNSVPTGQKITLKGNATFPNLEPIGELLFKDGLEINDGLSIIQYFKRLDPSKSASFSFNTKEGNTQMRPINLDAKPIVNTQQIPIGSIIASVLNYNSFLQANGLLVNGDMSKAIWIPCDGRILNASAYHNYGNVPDLRGVFLRGINDFGVTYTGVGNVSDNRKNPEDKQAGELQEDQFKKHNHGINYYQGVHWDFPSSEYAGAVQPLQNGQGVGAGKPTTDAGTATETRPKNVTVYYYLKIN